MIDQSTAIVTGAAGGIGAACAKRLAEEGYRVIATDHQVEKLVETFQDEEFVITKRVDHLEEGNIESCAEEILVTCGRVDVLVNNAGIMEMQSIEDTDDNIWSRTLKVNLEAGYRWIRALIPSMKKRRYGRIVNISSTESIASEPNLCAYTASKGGINAMTRTLAVELAPWNILVNAVAPGCIHTDMSVIHGVDETTTDEFKEWYVAKRKIPLARPGDAREIAKAVNFLSGEECTYITGQTLVVDGGLTITF